MRYVTLFLTLLAISISHLTEAQHYRLKKLLIQEYFNQDYVMRDSSIYHYSNGRGGIFTDKELASYLRQTDKYDYTFFHKYYNFMKYDSSQQYKWTNMSIPRFNTFQGFDINNNVISQRKKVNYPTISQYYDSSFYSYSGKLLIQSTDKTPHTYSHKYNFFKQPDTVFFSNGLPNIIYVYNGKQLLTELLIYTISSTPLSKKIYYYSSNNEPDSVVEQSYSSGVWHNNKVTVYTYNSRRMPTIETIYRYNATASGGVRYTFEEFITYYGKRNIIDSIYQKRHWSGIGWRNDMRHRFYYNASMYIDSLVTDRWDGTKWALFFDTSAISGCHKYSFSYEPYFPTNITTKNKLSIQTTIYPNPTTDFLYVLAQLKQSEPYTIQVTDLNGRVLKTWNEQATQTIQKQIPVAELPPGAYLLKLHTHDAEATERFIISK